MRISHFISKLLEPLCAAADGNGKRALRRALIVGSAALLAACATPTSVPLGTSESQAVATLGKPAAVYDLPDGGKRYFYPQGGVQQQAWMLEFDRAGRLVANDQVHSEAFFAKVRIGRDTEQDVMRLLGPPAWIEHYGPSSTTGWVYPYTPNPVSAFVTTVVFDAKGIVQRVEGGPDPRFAGGDWR